MLNVHAMDLQAFGLDHDQVVFDFVIWRTGVGIVVQMDTKRSFVGSWCVLSIQKVTLD